MIAINLDISRNDLVLAFSEALDLLDTSLHHHHMTVAFIAHHISEYLSITASDKNDLILAALLHDIGLFKREKNKSSLIGKTSAISSDELLENEFDEARNQLHSRIGYLLIHQYPSFENIAFIVLHHHSPYKTHGKDGTLLSQLLYLANYISLLIDNTRPLLVQRDNIVAQIKAGRGTRFMPILCDAFVKLAPIEAFWMAIEYKRMKDNVKSAMHSDHRIRTIAELFHVGRLFITAIDYRSRYTAAHSIGVSRVAKYIAELAMIPEIDQAIIEVSGYFHDIGKVAISKDILDKPGRLSDDEFAIIKSHAFYTFEILKNIDGFNEIAEIAAYHHERLDASGYPYHIRGQHLSDYSRLVAVADLFTALTEKRPYRNMLSKDQIVEILIDQVVKGQIENKYVDLVIRNFDALFEENASYQRLAYNDFNLFEENLNIEHYLFVSRIR